MINKIPIQEKSVAYSSDVTFLSVFSRSLKIPRPQKERKAG